ncbi:MAG: phosphoribosylanthranilate isomerase [Bacteroidales bacterium]|jgi:phosphoribosylanthranilate isomerase
MTGGLVKICGLRDPRNILDVIQLKPDLIGLIFYPGSKRYISNPESLEFLNDFQDRPLVTGVFVNPEIGEIRNISKIIKLDAIQLHGAETPEFCEALRTDNHIVIKAFGIESGFDFSLSDPYRGHADYFLFDTGTPGSGGSGKQFDWDLLDLYHGDTPYILSGGISPDTTILPVSPQMAGVDLNSRFETTPGVKSIDLLKKFLKKFRNE